MGQEVEGGRSFEGGCSFARLLYIYMYVCMYACVAVPGRNRTLFRCALGKLINVYTARMSPALNGSSALQRFECSNAIEIRNRIMFDFYLGLPHVCLYLCMYVCTMLNI